MDARSRLSVMTRHHTDDFAVFHVEPIEKLGLSDYPYALMGIRQIP